MREGDILLNKSRDGFLLWKVIRIVPFPRRGEIAHVLLYEEFSSRPSLDDVDVAGVAAWHSPVDREALEQDSEVLGNRPVTPDDLAGYFEFLKLTDFQAYLQEKGLSGDEVATLAKNAYDEGNRLSDEKRFEQALVAYARAIEHFPSFYEAHDNRAFALMDLARYREATAGFEESLRVHPDNSVALFSLGECYLRLGEHAKAVQVFQDCSARWPDQPHHHEFLQQAQELASATVSKTKPWWRFW